jgi:alkylation response protein AidB-like acyl-CoA dehydrogenase
MKRNRCGRPLAASRLIEDLKAKAKSENLWNLFLPEVSVCRISNTRHSPKRWAESSGFGNFQLQRAGHGKYGVLEKYGTQEQKDEWLKSLLAGEFVRVLR